MAKGPSEPAGRLLDSQEVAGEYRRAVADLDEARDRVLRIQTKLTVGRPMTLIVGLMTCSTSSTTRLPDGWLGSRAGKSRSTNGRCRWSEAGSSAPRTARFLRELRDDLKARRFAPLPVRERMIPKVSGKFRRLGIPTARDRCVQASLKLVLEPVFEAGFKPCTYGFRPTPSPGRHRGDSPLRRLLQVDAGR